MIIWNNAGFTHYCNSIMQSHGEVVQFPTAHVSKKHEQTTNKFKIWVESITEQPKSNEIIAVQQSNDLASCICISQMYRRH